jgi:hypothetical protein
MPTVRNIVTATFHTPPGPAFRIPILGDATRFLTGYLVIPAMTGFEEDTYWGQVGGSRLPVAAKTIFSKGGVVGYDEVLVREEDRCWKWQVTGFRDPGLFFLERAVGEWQVESVSEDTTRVTWTYTLHARSTILYPFAWLFGKLFWKGMQRKALRSMKELAESGAELVYS